MGALETLIWAH